MSTAEQKPKDDKAYLWKWATAITLATLLARFGFDALAAYRASSGPSLTASVRGGGFSMPQSVLAKVGETDAEKFSALKGRLTLQIRNSGNLNAEEVRLQTNDRGIAWIEWDDGNAEEIGFQNDVPIGELPIAKSVTITLWTENLPDENSPPLVAHKSGSTHASYPATISPWLVLFLSLTTVFMIAKDRLGEWRRRKQGRKLIESLRQLDSRLEDIETRNDSIAQRIEESQAQLSLASQKLDALDIPQSP